MKHEKRLTRSHKILLEKYGLNPDNWHYERDTPKELVLVHKHTGHVRRIHKE